MNCQVLRQENNISAEKGSVLSLPAQTRGPYKHKGGELQDNGTTQPMLDPDSRLAIQHTQEYSLNLCLRLRHVRNQVHDAVAVAPLIVIPRHQLHKSW